MVKKKNQTVPCRLFTKTEQTHVFSVMFLTLSVVLSPAIHHNGLSMNHALLGLSPNIPPGPKEGDLAHDMSHEVKRMHTDKGQSAFT